MVLSRLCIGPDFLPKFYSDSYSDLNQVPKPRKWNSNSNETKKNIQIIDSKFFSEKSETGAYLRVSVSSETPEIWNSNFEYNWDERATVNEYLFVHCVGVKKWNSLQISEPMIKNFYKGIVIVVEKVCRVTD